jgi:superfamily II DNA or RNA helicase
MVKQRRFSDLSSEAKEHARRVVHRFSKGVCSKTSASGLGVLRLRDAQGQPRRLYTHQVIAAQRLLQREGRAPWAQRKASLLAIHEVGSGKTVTAILVLAAVRVLNPHRAETKTLIVCPLSVLEMWLETVRAWTTLDGEQVLAACKQAALTEGAIARASVIVTTPETLVAAFKTFVHVGTEPEDLKKPRMQRFKHGVAPTDTKRREQLGGAQPPVHPLFLLLAQPLPQFALVVVDEIHRVSNPLTLAGHVVGMFTGAATYKLGLTGTPVSSKPSQIANLARAIDGRPEWLQKARHFFTPKGGNDRSLRRSAVAAWHEHLVDRVDASFIDLPEKRCLLLEYDPFVGLRANGAVWAEAIEKHNSTLASAQQMAAVGGETIQWGEEQRAAFSAIVALGNFEFSALLGVRGAKAFEDEPSLYAEAAAAPSQTMRLIARVIASRQQAGHARVTVFCESTTQLKILRRYLERQEHAVGALLLFDGALSATQRAATVRQFLECAKGVLLLSGAGSIGITLCPGCEVLLSVGSLPWNASTVDQAFGRIYRIGQDRPVEIIQFAARRSVTFAKLGLHADKRERLARAAADEDYSQFVDGDKWRETRRILSSCAPLDVRGNYVLSDDQAFKLRQYRRLVERCDANGVPRPAPPPNLPQAPVLADRVALPPVSFQGLA